MHLDFAVYDVQAAVAKAVGLGATKAAAQYGGESCVTMFDTEGHPFCICKRVQSESEFARYYEQVGYGTIPDISVNIDCITYETLREFYARLTDWDQGFHPTALIPENRMVVHFMETDFDYIPPVWPEEQGKQQKHMHFNFQVDDLSATVEEAIRLGARKAAEQYGGDHFVTLLDTDGHPFCLCQR
jgi:hypothetical protein